MVQSSQESRRKYWATRSSVRSHRSLHSLPRSWESVNFMSQYHIVLNHSGMAATGNEERMMNDQKEWMPTGNNKWQWRWMNGKM